MLVFLTCKLKIMTLPLTPPPKQLLNRIKLWGGWTRAPFSFFTLKNGSIRKPLVAGDF